MITLILNALRNLNKTHVGRKIANFFDPIE